MTINNGCQIHNENGWIKEIKRYKHHSPTDDYYSEEIESDERYEYRKEFWEYLEENEYWD